MRSRSHASAVALYDWREEDGETTAPSDCTFVEPEEFVRLAVSWRKLERRDVQDCELAGLFDLATNEWFVVPRERLTEALMER